MPVGTVKWFNPNKATASSSPSPATTYSSTSAPPKKVARWKKARPSSSTSPRAARPSGRQRAPGRHPGATLLRQDYRELVGQRRTAHKASACCMKADPPTQPTALEPTPATGGLPGRPPGPSMRTGSHRKLVERTYGLSEQHAASAYQRPVPPNWGGTGDHTVSPD